MMKPSVGLTLLTSSSMILLTIVVLPALSSPLLKVSSDIVGPGRPTYSIRMRISLSLSRAFRRTDNMLSIYFQELTEAN